MTGFKSPFARKSALALTMLGGAMAMLGGAKANAQQSALQQAQQNLDNCIGGASCRDAEGDMIAAKRAEAAQESRMMDIIRNGPEKSPAPVQLQVDTAENRQFANRIYATAFAGIDKVLKTQGKEAALTLSQNPQNNPALVALIKQAHEGQFFLTAITISDTMVDAKAYIDGNGSSVLPTAMSNSRWSSTASGAKEYLDMRTSGVSELSFLEKVQYDPNYLGPRTQIGSQLIAKINKATPVQTASLRQ